MGQDGFYLSSKGRRAEDFFALKSPTASAGFEPANLATKGQHALLDHRSRCGIQLAFIKSLHNYYQLLDVLFVVSCAEILCNITIHV
jgi:hypothetical protein